MMTHFVVPAVLALAGTIFGQVHAGGGEFHSLGITRSGRLQFDAGVETVFPLFTPLGEKHWARGWNPEILFPLDRDVAQGMVFRTHEGVEHIWTVIAYDPGNHTVAYNVVGEGVLVRQIRVRCQGTGPGHTEAEVTDSYIGLSRQGNEFIENLSEAAYEKKMAEWKEAIGAYLATAKPVK
jgi:hypothetical protein